MAAHIRGPLYFEQMGKSGPTLIFLHPNPLDQSCWMYQMAHLSTWFKCVAIDLPGYGRSPGADDGLSLDDVAAGCWEVVDQMSTDGPIVLVGCSIGSVLIPYMYLQRPTETTAVVMTGGGGLVEGSARKNHVDRFQEEKFDYRWRFTFQDFSPTFRASPMAVYFAELWAERNDKADLDSIIRLLEALNQSDPQYVLQLACPTLIVSGTEDAGHAMALKLKTHLPHADFKIIPGAGHACHLEMPWVYDKYVLEFLTEQGLLFKEGAT